MLEKVNELAGRLLMEWGVRDWGSLLPFRELREKFFSFKIMIHKHLNTV